MPRSEFAHNGGGGYNGDDYDHNHEKNVWGGNSIWIIREKLHPIEAGVGGNWPEVPPLRC